jgi:hypothetical protein
VCSVEELEGQTVDLTDLDTYKHLSAAHAVRMVLGLDIVESDLATVSSVVHDFFALPSCCFLCVC